jgi:hypothetical protein
LLAFNDDFSWIPRVRCPLVFIIGDGISLIPT